MTVIGITDEYIIGAPKIQNNFDNTKSSNFLIKLGIFIIWFVAAWAWFFPIGTHKLITMWEKKLCKKKYLSVYNNKELWKLRDVEKNMLWKEYWNKNVISFFVHWGEK